MTPTDRFREALTLIDLLHRAAMSAMTISGQVVRTAPQDRAALTAAAQSLLDAVSRAESNTRPLLRAIDGGKR